jgi:hypothetical protein
MKLNKGILNKKKSIYTDVDSILDTRAPIAMRLDPINVLKDIRSERYINRIRDNFGNISYDVFRSYYARRNSEILPHASPTAILGFIKDLHEEIILDLKNNNLEEDVVIYVNLYPYILNKTDINKIVDLVLTQVPGSLVEIIFDSYETLTPEWIYNHVGAMFMYDLPYWIEYHTQNTNLVQTVLLNVMGIAPSLINFNALGAKIDENYFKDFQKMMNFVMEYYPIAAKYFSGLLFWPQPEQQ